MEQEAERKAQAIPSLTAEVLFYAAREAIRNAAHHGRDREAACPLHLLVGVAWHDPSAVSGQHGLEITIEDNGVGLGAANRSERSSGQGLALHSTMMAVVGGTLAVKSVPGAYTRLSLTLPEETCQEACS